MSSEVAKALAVQEYEKYRTVQDSRYKSDFDRFLKKVKIRKLDPMSKS